ncbi:MAG: glycosyltransferase [Terracidiphilus sp.]|jgi:glycosyltransferase involved in cell wall biosynthesis
MTQRPRLLLLIPHLGGGGAEQVTTMLAGSLSREKYDLHLGLITQTKDDVEALPSSVGVHCLGARRVRSGAFRLLRLVWRLRPEVILSGMAHLNFLVLLLRPLFPPRTRVLVRQNGTVSSQLASGDLPTWTGLMYRLLYRRADRVICQSRAMAEDLCKQIGISPERLAVLPNPVDVVGIRSATASARSPWTGPGPHLLAVGRLSREKGFDLLLQAMATLQTRFPNADLAIAGAGLEEAALRAQCRGLELDSAVRFLGHLNSPAEWFPGASLFVVSSRHEGLPNALLEAAAGGLPIAALPASEGMVDLLSGKPGVWLASEISVSALAESLTTALGTLQPGQRFPHAWIEEFRVERAVLAYEYLIDATRRQVGA